MCAQYSSVRAQYFFVLYGLSSVTQIEIEVHWLLLTEKCQMKKASSNCCVKQAFIVDIFPHDKDDQEQK